MLRLFIPRNTKFQHNFIINILIVMTNIKNRIQSSLIIKQLLWNWVHIGLAFFLIYRHFYACWGELFQIFGICIYLMIGYGSKCYGTCRKPRENGASFSQMTIKRVYKDIIVFLPPLSKVVFLFSLISDIK